MALVTLPLPLPQVQPVRMPPHSRDAATLATDRQEAAVCWD